MTARAQCMRSRPCLHPPPLGSGPCTKFAQFSPTTRALYCLAATIRTVYSPPPPTPQWLLAVCACVLPLFSHAAPAAALPPPTVVCTLHATSILLVHAALLDLSLLVLGFTSHATSPTPCEATCYNVGASSSGRYEHTTCSSRPGGWGPVAQATSSSNPIWPPARGR